MLKRRLFIALMLALMLSALPLVTWAHGESAITVTPDTIAPGGKITVNGEEMGAGEEFKISLEGLNYQAELGDAKANDQEEFTLDFTIPADAPEGTYQVKATGEDGDVVTAELTITPTKAAAEAEPTPAVEVMPSAAEHELARSRTPLEIISLFGLVVASVAVGFILLRGK